MNKIAGESLEQRIFSISGSQDFENLALDVFHFQYQNCTVYQKFCDALDMDVYAVQTISEIPFLPVELFKKHRIVSFEGEEEIVFSSSGTTGSIPSKHYIRDVKLYEKSFLQSFRLFYGDPSEYCILALLPAYLERKGSSLVYMAGQLIKASGHSLSGFHLKDLDVLADKLVKLMDSNQKVLLIGVSFALLDLATLFPMRLSNATIMETGGMKGRRREMIRAELHQTLCEAFDQEVIHSEYGMTELLSQAYSKGKGLFTTPPWMQVLIRDSNDPLEILEAGRTGGVNIVDFANLYSCSFIATQDLGRINSDGTFEVLGRFDNSDVRGCNLMIG